MINWTADLASSLVTKAMENVWERRTELCAPGMIAHFDYRIVPICSEEDNIFVYFVMSRQWWWYTINTTPPYMIRREELIFHGPIEDEDLTERGSSYQHYLFGDVLKPVLHRRLDGLDANKFYVSSLFPLHTITVGEIK